MNLEQAFERMNNLRRVWLSQILNLDGQAREDMLNDIKALEKILGFIRNQQMIADMEH